MLARQCYSASLQPTPQESLPIDVLDPRDEPKIERATTTEELLQIPFDKRSLDRSIKVSLELNQEDLTELTQTLRENADVFCLVSS